MITHKFSFEDFKSVFEGFLKGTPRWDAFSFIVYMLSKKNDKVYIMETGSIRAPGNWAGDGCSTAVWSWIIAQTDGYVASIDIDPEIFRLQRHKFPNVDFFTSDSLEFLTLFRSFEELDLLYLDSYDYNGAPSSLHHVGELAIAYPKLKSGCMVAVDDCHSDASGKHVLVQKFFDLAGVKPAVKSHITVWIKP